MSALLKLYRQNKITYKRTLWQYRTAEKNEVNLDTKRYEFAKLLAQLILSDTPFVYVDESRYE